MPANQLFADWTAGQSITAAKLNQMKNDVAALAGANFTGAIQVNGSTVWHAGNDGSGSGMDADTVDGYNASQLLSVSGGPVEVLAGDYTLIAADWGKHLVATAALELTLPAGLQNGYRVRLANHSGGAVSFVAGGGASVVTRASLAFVAEDEFVEFVYDGDGTWYGYGGLASSAVMIEGSLAGVELVGFAPTVTT
jgi:hypothetical protein